MLRLCPSDVSSHHEACRSVVRTTSSKTGYCGHHRAKKPLNGTGRTLHSLELNTCEAKGHGGWESIRRT